MVDIITKICSKIINSTKYYSWSFIEQINELPHSEIRLCCRRLIRSGDLQNDNDWHIGKPSLSLEFTHQKQFVRFQSLLLCCSSADSFRLIVVLVEYFDKKFASTVNVVQESEEMIGSFDNFEFLSKIF